MEEKEAKLFVRMVNNIALFNVGLSLPDLRSESAESKRRTKTIADALERSNEELERLLKGL